MRNRLISFVLGAAMTVGLSTSVSADPLGVQVSEFPTENAALIEATLSFFEAVENETAPKSRVPVIGLPLTVTKSKAVAGESNVLTRMGPVQHLTGYNITWYPTDVMLGTVDFMGTWNGNRNLVCGYLTWDLSDPSAPELQSVSASFVDLGALSHTSDVQIHRSLMRANCAYGDVEANYRLFDVTG